MSDMCPVVCPQHRVVCGILLGVDMPGFSTAQSAADHEHNCLPVKDKAGHLILMHRFGSGRQDRYMRRDPTTGTLVNVSAREFHLAVREVQEGPTPIQQRERDELMVELRKLLARFVAPVGNMRPVWKDDKVTEANTLDLWGVRRVVEYWRKRAQPKEAK